MTTKDYNIRKMGDVAVGKQKPANMMVLKKDEAKFTKEETKLRVAFGGGKVLSIECTRQCGLIISYNQTIGPNGKIAHGR